MKQELLLTLVSASAVLLLAGACDGGTEGACKVDTDCPQGTICREERCGPVGADASAPAPADAAPTTCSSDGLSCLAPEECCSRVCTGGTCGSAAPVPTTPACRGLYELCQDDCCAGLTCTAGSCR